MKVTKTPEIYLFAATIILQNSHWGSIKPNLTEQKEVLVV